MKFKRLTIERPFYGKDEGKLIAEISVQGEKSSITMQLPEKVADEIISLARQALIDSVEKTANDFIFELTTFIPEVPKLKEGKQ